MFQRHGMILESRMEVGLRRMARVAGLGEQGKIGQTKPFDQRSAVFDSGGTCRPQPGGIGQREEKGHRQAQKTKKHSKSRTHQQAAPNRMAAGKTSERTGSGDYLKTGWPRA